jgi:hypothetical protein
VDTFNSIVIALITSVVVSAGVFFALKTWLETRLKHYFEVQAEKLRHDYEIELERLKNQPAIAAETAHELTEKRPRAYTQLIEVVYRVRNIAREIAGPTETPPILMTEFAARTKELEDSLYIHRLDLERDGVFLPLHTYKNTAKTFTRLLEDRDHYLHHREKSEAQAVSEELRRLYLEIEKQHKPTIELLSGITPSDETGIMTNIASAS